MTKNEVDKEKVKSFVFMPESVETSLRLWWANLPNDILLVCNIPMKNIVELEWFQTVLRLALRSYFLSLLTIIHKLMEGDWIPELLAFP